MTDKDTFHVPSLHYDTSNSIAHNFNSTVSASSLNKSQAPTPTQAASNSNTYTDNNPGNQVGNSNASSVNAVYNEEFIHKTILVGDSGVGKTSILVQFDQGKFQSGVIRIFRSCFYNFVSLTKFEDS